MQPTAIEDAILEDIFQSSRSFLPGRRCGRREVSTHLRRAILLDGLGREESSLVLSTLPQGADRIYLTPLDKGLSGSKVFSAKFDIEGKRVSKIFVLKIGPKDKIAHEHSAIERLVSPHINGVGSPVYRNGPTTALIAQELAGLTPNTTLQSLKNFVRIAEHPERVVMRLLEERLGTWYLPAQQVPPSAQGVEKLFKGYLSKVHAPVYPATWVDLQEWVRSITTFHWGDVDRTISAVKRQSISSPGTIIHGDLHAQNVLVDEREECWPIDFAWCRDNTSPALDFTMLECSLKFLAIPQRSDLFTFIGLEQHLAREPYPAISMAMAPYSGEIRKVVRAISAVRKFALERVGLSFNDYRRCLCLMTYCHATHPKLNLPFVLASLQILAALQER